MVKLVQLQKPPVSSREDFVNLFNRNCIPQRMFEEAERSKAVQTYIKVMEKEWRESQISDVPALVANGKYKINLSALKSKQDLAELVNMLSEKVVNGKSTG